ncbi:MAG: ABC transporter permease, partial [Actinobacteria bacterium]
MSLYKAELRRLGKRRVTRLTTLLGLLVLLGIATDTVFRHPE